MMEAKWRRLTRSVGQACGAYASICFQKLADHWIATAWYGDTAQAEPSSWHFSDGEKTILLTHAMKQGILLTTPEQGLEILPVDQISRVYPTPTSVALLTLPDFKTNPLVFWLALSERPETSRLSSILDVVAATTDCVASYRWRFIEEMPAVYISTDMEGIIQDCNSSTSMTGYSKEELIGQPASLLFAQGENTRLRARLLEQPQVEHFEAMVKNRAGESIMVGIQAMILFEDGLPVQFLSISHDLREKQHQDHFRRQQAMGRLISGIAHELNNPLQTVLGNAEMLAEMKLPEAAKRRTERVFSGARRCQEVVDSLLRLKLVPKDAGEEIDLPELLKHCLKTIAKEFTNLQVNHSLRSDVEVPQIMGQAADLELALCNLIRNGFQAAAQQELPRVTLSLKNAGKTVQLIIEDNGPGMTPGTLERAFDPFFTTREIGAGKGLGLNIALAIIQEHGGLIEIRSIQETTQVVVTLPFSGFKPF